MHETRARTRLLLPGFAVAAAIALAGCGSGTSGANPPTETAGNQVSRTPGCGQTQAGVSATGDATRLRDDDPDRLQSPVTVHQAQFLGGASSCGDFAEGTGRIESTPGGWDIPQINATVGGESVQETYTISSFHGPGSYTIQAAQGQVAIGGESYSAPSVAATVNSDGSGSVAVTNLTNGNGAGGSTLTDNGTITWTCAGA